jgi:hypothetical protein
VSIYAWSISPVKVYSYQKRIFRLHLPTWILLFLVPLSLTYLCVTFVYLSVYISISGPCFSSSVFIYLSISAISPAYGYSHQNRTLGKFSNNPAMSYRIFINVPATTLYLHLSKSVFYVNCVNISWCPIFIHTSIRWPNTFQKHSHRNGNSLQAAHIDEPGWLIRTSSSFIAIWCYILASQIYYSCAPPARLPMTRCYYEISSYRQDFTVQVHVVFFLIQMSNQYIMYLVLTKYGPIESGNKNLM